MTIYLIGQYGEDKVFQIVAQFYSKEEALEYLTYGQILIEGYEK